MAKYIDGINLEILKWARERSGFSAKAAAKSLSKTESFIHECESGDRALKEKKSSEDSPGGRIFL